MSVAWVWASMSSAGLGALAETGHLNLISCPQIIPILSCSCDTKSSMEQNDFPATPYHFAICSLEISSMMGRRTPHREETVEMLWAKT